MALVVNTNVQSLIASRALTHNTFNLNKSIEKLSTGFRINRASDDAAGLTISEGLKAQMNGYLKARDNAQDGINVLQIAEGDLEGIGENLHRIRELTVQAANDTNNAEARAAIQAEIDARIDEIDRISGASEFNSKNLLDGSLSTGLILQVGQGAGDTLAVATANFATADSVALSVSGQNVSTASAAAAFLSNVDIAIVSVASRRANIGALVNRLEGIVTSLSVAHENVSAANSRIRDVDVAKEAANLTKYQILQQASLSLLAQANQSPAAALALLG